MIPFLDSERCETSKVRWRVSHPVFVSSRELSAAKRCPRDRVVITRICRLIPFRNKVSEVAHRRIPACCMPSTEYKFHNASQAGCFASYKVARPSLVLIVNIMPDMPFHQTSFAMQDSITLAIDGAPLYPLQLGLYQSMAVTMQQPYSMVEIPCLR